jgi:hypothetical protein
MMEKRDREAGRIVAKRDTADEKLGAENIVHRRHDPKGVRSFSCMARSD